MGKKTPPDGAQLHVSSSDATWCDGHVALDLQSGAFFRRWTLTHGAAIRLYTQIGAVLRTARHDAPACAACARTPCEPDGS